ncbi:hypothetical protein ACFYW6_17880 [Streptomyces sp. NPDC002659]|uniref:hypothetical protein n=1 Tax=Streptomyces sp. NPDC002659 TaxID=3364656 RepID=UPI00369C5279
MTQGQSMPYPRISGDWTFGAPVRLDTSAMQRMWLPWITLEADPESHLLARNAHLAWHHTRNVDPDDILARPWTTTYAAAGLRTWILGQARAADQIGGKDIELSEPMAEFRGAWQVALESGEPLRQLQMTSVLGNLTTSAPLVNTPQPDPSVKDPLLQHYCYEHSKVLRQRDATHAPSLAAMEYLAENALEPALRLLAAINLVVHVLRIQQQVDGAAPWVAHGEALLGKVQSHERWLALLTESRFHRLIALYHWRQGQRAETEERLGLCKASDDLLRKEVEADGSPVLRHLWMENHRLLLEVTIKKNIGSAPALVADEVQELDRLEPYYPDSQYFIGEMYARGGSLAVGADHFLKAAACGDIRGAMAAHRAFECFRELGDTDSAQNSLEILRDLDPAVDLSGV